MSRRARWGVALGCAALFFLFADAFLAPPDCVSYWAWGEGLVRRLQFSFMQEYVAFDTPIHYIYVTATGRLANDWPMGSGIALVPWLLLGPVIAHAWVVALVAAAFAAWCRLVDGTGVGIGVAVLATLVGTPLGFYVAFGPFFSHAVSFVVITLFLVLWAGTRAGRSVAEWFLLGLLLGFAATVRPQNILCGVVFLFEIPRLLREHRIPRARDMAGAVLGGMLGLLPHLVAMTMLHGSPFALPKVDEMNWLNPQFGAVLLSDFHGIAPWTPLVLLGVGGLLVLMRRDAVLGGGLLAVFVLQFYVNAANAVWWCGGSFGNRRLVDVSIVVAWGLLAIWQATQGRRSLRMAWIVALVGCCAWTLWLVLAERRLVMPLDRYVPMLDPEFLPGMMTVLTEPGATWRSLVRWEAGPGTVLVRLAASAMVLAAIMGAPVLAGAVRRDTMTRVAAIGALGGVVMGMLVTIAALRTPPVEDPGIVAMVGTEPGVLWDNYLELAHYRLVREEYIKSEEAARRALAIWDGSATPWVALARAFYFQERWVSAIEASTRALELDPNHVMAMDVRAAAIAEIR